MAEIARWNERSFIVSPNLIRSFQDLTIKGSSATEDKTTGKQNYVTRKNGQATEIGMTVMLSALTGSDVKTEALEFVRAARLGETGYFYLNGEKLVTCQLMLTSANVSETKIAPNGTWVSCRIALTFKQCSKYDAEESGSSSKGSSSGSNSRPSSKKSSTDSSGLIATVVNTARSIVSDAVNAAKSAVLTTTTAKDYISSVTAKAKSASSSTKSSGTMATLKAEPMTRATLKAEPMK